MWYQKIDADYYAFLAVHVCSMWKLPFYQDSSRSLELWRGGGNSSVPVLLSAYASAGTEWQVLPYDIDKERLLCQFITQADQSLLDPQFCPPSPYLLPKMTDFRRRGLSPNTIRLIVFSCQWREWAGRSPLSILGTTLHPPHSPSPFLFPPSNAVSRNSPPRAGRPPTCNDRESLDSLQIRGSAIELVPLDESLELLEDGPSFARDHEQPQLQEEGEVLCLHDGLAALPSARTQLFPVARKSTLRRQLWVPAPLSSHMDAMQQLASVPHRSSERMEVELSAAGQSAGHHPVDADTDTRPERHRVLEQSIIEEAIHEAAASAYARIAAALARRLFECKDVVESAAAALPLAPQRVLDASSRRWSGSNDALERPLTENSCSPRQSVCSWASSLSPVDALEPALSLSPVDALEPALLVADVEDGASEVQEGVDVAYQPVGVAASQSDAPHQSQGSVQTPADALEQPHSASPPRSVEALHTVVVRSAVVNVAPSPRAAVALNVQPRHFAMPVHAPVHDELSTSPIALDQAQRKLMRRKVFSESFGSIPPSNDSDGSSSESERETPYSALSESRCGPVTVVSGNFDGILGLPPGAWSDVRRHSEPSPLQTTRHALPKNFSATNMPLEANFLRASSAEDSVLVSPKDAGEFLPSPHEAISPVSASMPAQLAATLPIASVGLVECDLLPRDSTMSPVKKDRNAMAPNLREMKRRGLAIPLPISDKRSTPPEMARHFGVGSEDVDVAAATQAALPTAREEELLPPVPSRSHTASRIDRMLHQDEFSSRHGSRPGTQVSFKSTPSVTATPLPPLSTKPSSRITSAAQSRITSAAQSRITSAAAK